MIICIITSVMSAQLVGLLLDLFRDHNDDPAPVATADHIDASMNFEELDYEPYRLRLHHIQLHDSFLITRIEQHPDEPVNQRLKAFFGKLKRSLLFTPALPTDQPDTWQLNAFLRLCCSSCARSVPSTQSQLRPPRWNVLTHVSTPFSFSNTTAAIKFLTPAPGSSTSAWMKTKAST